MKVLTGEDLDSPSGGGKKGTPSIRSWQGDQYVGQYTGVLPQRESGCRQSN